MLTTWLTVWVLRVLVDHLPTSFVPSPHHLLSLGSSSEDHNSFVFSSSSSFSSSSPSNLDLILHEGLNNSSNGLVELDRSSIKSIGRALSHIIGLLNEMPATSRKYQLAVAMADRIVEENMRNGHLVLQEINRSGLSAAFIRTANMLYRSMEGWGQMEIDQESGEAWPCRAIGAVPVLGSVFVSYFKGLRYCVNTILPLVTTTTSTRRSACSSMMMMNNNSNSSESAVAEKLAQELLWLTNKLRGCLAVDEALVQWSYASGLASTALTAHPRVQGTLVKISGAMLIEEIARGEFEVPRQVKYRILLLWLPLFCYASGGLSYAILTGYEKAEMERVIDEVISTLPLDDQEQILMNWMHDFTYSTSDWPNLQNSYYRWFHLCRELLV